MARGAFSHPAAWFSRAQPLTCMCFLGFAFSRQHAGQGFSVLLTLRSTGSSARERENSQLFQQEECLLCEHLFSEILCSGLETGVCHCFDHTAHRPQPTLMLPPVTQIYLLSWKLSALLWAVCVLGVEMQFHEPSVAGLWLAMSTKVFWRTFIITKWGFFLF